MPTSSPNLRSTWALGLSLRQLAGLYAASQVSLIAAEFFLPPLTDLSLLSWIRNACEIFGFTTPHPFVGLDSIYVTD